jgi:hypothetical protein
MVARAAKRERKYFMRMMGGCDRYDILGSVLVPPKCFRFRVGRVESEGGRGVEDFEVRVAFAEEAEWPFRGEEDDGSVIAVAGDGGVAGAIDIGVSERAAVLAAEPADVVPRGGFEAGLRIVFCEEAVLYDFELEGADGTEEGYALGGVGLGELLDDAFFEQLVEAFAESFGVGNG